MSEHLPSRYVAYPRGDGTETYGSIEKLRGLGEGYFEIGSYITPFIISPGVIAWLVATKAISFVMLALFVLFHLSITSFRSYRANLKITLGCDLPRRYALIASILLGITACLPVGMLVILAIQTLARREMRNYGLNVGLFFNKQSFEKFVQDRIERDREGATLTPFIDGPEVG